MAIAKRECHLHKKSNVIKMHSNELNGMSLSHHIESESNNSLSNSGSGSVRNCHVLQMCIVSSSNYVIHGDV